MKINYLLLFGTILCSCVRVDDHPGVREHIVSQFLTVSSIELRYNEYEENNGLFYIGSNGNYADKETRERLWKEYDDYHYNKVQVEPLLVSMNVVNERRGPDLFLGSNAVGLYEVWKSAFPNP